MKHRMKDRAFIIALLIAWVSIPVAGSAQENGFSDLPAWTALPVFIQEHQDKGLSGSSVRWPELVTEDETYLPAVEKINQEIHEQAHIPAYLQLLAMVSEGSTGLRMDYEIGVLSYHSADMPDGQSQLGNPYLSILFSAEGKMLQGRPSQVYYSMTFDLRTGEGVSFDQLFTDPDAAKERIEALLEADVEPTLSTYLENNQLFPVPYDRFFLDGFGHLILVYEQNQLSFLSGYSGAVSFRASELLPDLTFSNEELEGYFDAYRTAPADLRAWNVKQFLRFSPIIAHSIVQLGEPLEDALAWFRSTTDSGYYPGGAYYEVEDANYRGALILTDESETTVTGVLASRTDLLDLQTGKTTLAEAEAFLGMEPAMRMSIDDGLAQLYLVCPGTACIYEYPSTANTRLRLTLYSDWNDIVQYVKLEQI